jgi:hypothetical protein
MRRCSAGCTVGYWLAGVVARRQKLAQLLQTRSGVWPKEEQTGLIDPTMRKSCLLQLSKQSASTADK